MSGYSSIHWRSDQQGAVIMIMLLILVLGSASFLLTKLSKGDPQQPRMVDVTTEFGEITEALIGFAMSNGGCLPCPSSSATSGTALGACSTAATRVGFLPWADLGLGTGDRWSHRYRYKVDPNYATGSGCTFATPADMSIQTRDSLGVPQFISPPNSLAAVIVSHGPNGLGAFNFNGNPQPNPPATHFDELANRNNATLTFMQRPMDLDPAVIGGPFDDVVGWVSRQRLRDQIDDSDCCGTLPL